MTTILIADDHPMVRNALALTLRATFGECSLVEAGSQSSLEQALNAQTKIDLVLLDLRIPGASGFSALLQLRASHPELPVIVISAHDRPRNIRRARLYGAAGFISKSADMAQMQDALRTVRSGQAWFPENAGDRDDDEDVARAMAQRLAELTPQQLRVLSGLAEGLLNKQIAHELNVSENTIKVHVSAILKKLEVGRRTQAALLARELMEADEEINHIG